MSTPSTRLSPVGQVIENYSGSLDDIIFTDLKPIEIRVTIGDDKYVLVEASGAAACEWQNSLLRGTRLGPDGRPESLDGMADAEPKLVSLCLFRILSDGPQIGGRVPVALTTIKGWPGRVQRLLYKKAREISQLDDEDTEESLTRRIAELQLKLDKIKAVHPETNGSVAKN